MIPLKWGLAGGAGLLLLLSLKKKRRARIYMPVQGDRPTAIAARFGVDFTTLFEANGKRAILAGQPATLPVTAKDSGPRPQAMGKVT